MTTYEFQYSLEVAPEGRTDGSGQVVHDIKAKAREAGSGDPWVDVPGLHKNILVPHDELATVMAMPHSSGAERVAKNGAYKDLLATHRASPPIGASKAFTAVNMQAYLDANDGAATQAAAADSYITVTLGQPYPVAFTL